MKPPTPRQLECLRAIDAYIRANGISPSNRDIAIAISTTASRANAYVLTLESSGLISLGAMRVRSVRLTQAGQYLLYPPTDAMVYRAEARIEELGL